MLRDESWVKLLNSDVGSDSKDILSNYEFILYLNERLFRKYEPTKAPGVHFIDRLESWVNNVNELEEKKALFNLVPKIFFIGEEEFNSLYRVAFQEVIIPWLISDAELKFFAPNFELNIIKELGRTWFCPISDSLRINAFYHVNHITGRDYRPDWRSLSKFADVEKIESFIKKSEITRIVLLEDFVGSGGQALGILYFLEKINVDIEILIIPLSICPKGDLTIKEAIQDSSKVSYKPVVVIPESEIFTSSELGAEKIEHQDVRKINEKYADKMSLDITISDDEKIKIGTFGYRNTGALVVMYSNCPNNTIAMIHHKGDDWKPLFPRSERYGS